MDLLEVIKNDNVDDISQILDSEMLSTAELDHLEYNFLLEAIHYKSIKIVRLLLNRGCRIFYNIRANTPLHLAVTGTDNILIVDALLTRGASLTIKNENGNTPLHVAFLNGTDSAVLDLLLERCYRLEELNLSNDKGLTFLHIACTRPKLDIIQHFIETSEDPYCINAQVALDFTSTISGYTPLHFAVKFKLIEVIFLLFLQPYIDIYKQDANLSTPVHLACESSDVMVIHFILKHDKLRKNSVNISGLSHFMAACMTGDLDLVNSFLDKAKDPYELINGRIHKADTFPFAGYTPLHFAAINGHTSVVEKLLAYGAKIYAEMDSPLDLARKNNHDETAYVLYCHAVKIGIVQDVNLIYL